MSATPPGGIPETVGETTSFTTRDFKATMGRFASGVTVVTTRLGALRAGITVNAFCSLSLEPPLVLICIDRSSRVHDVLAQAGIFAANLLTADQEPLSRCFAGHSEARWEEFCGCPTHVVATGAPVFDESLGFVDCRIVDIFPGGDHSIVVGRVEALGASAGRPLLYYEGRYGLPRGASRRGNAPSPSRAASGDAAGDEAASDEAAGDGRGGTPTSGSHAPRAPGSARRGIRQTAATADASRPARDETRDEARDGSTPSAASGAPRGREA